jgi:hypothetical protein
MQISQKMDRRRAFPSRIFVTIVETIVRVFSRAKRSEKDVKPDDGNWRRFPLVLHKFRSRGKERGSLRSYINRNDGLRVRNSRG